MDDHARKAIALSEKIVTKAEDALSGLDREMAIMKWPGDFRAIMWETVADIATRRALEAKSPRST